MERGIRRERGEEEDEDGAGGVGGGGVSHSNGVRREGGREGKGRDGREGGREGRWPRQWGEREKKKMGKETDSGEG